MLRALLIKIGDNDMCSSSAQQQGNFAADSAGAADDEGDLAAEFCFGRHALELRFFERPVFDAECFRARKRDIVVELRELLRLLRVTRLRQRMRDRTFFERIRACHHVDGVDEELGCDACFFLVLAESKKAESRHDDDGWIGVAKLGGIAVAHSS